VRISAVPDESPYTPLTASRLVGSPVTITQPDSGIPLYLAVPGFPFELKAPIISLRPAHNAVVIQAAVDRGVRVVLSVEGTLIEGKDRLQPEQANLRIELDGDRPRCEFVAATLHAVLGLATEKVQCQVPEIGLDLTMSFELSPPRLVSQMLRRRQLGYRLMVIERATGTRFTLSESVSGADAVAADFIYHALVDRSFVKSVAKPVVPARATPMWLSQLTPYDRVAFRKLGPVHIAPQLFGQPIALGPATVIIERGKIQRPAEIRRELELADGHPVDLEIQSCDGRVKYEFPEAPHLPANPWDPTVKALVDLEPKLADRLAERYHALAAATLADLTEEEKQLVTARPELTEDGFLDDHAREND